MKLLCDKINNTNYQNITVWIYKQTGFTWIIASLSFECKRDPVSLILTGGHIYNKVLLIETWKNSSPFPGQISQQNMQSHIILTSVTESKESFIWLEFNQNK